MILYEGKCAGKVVTLIDGLQNIIVPDCKIFGNGTAPSSNGIVIADQDRFYYIPLTTPDTEKILDKAEGLCDKLKNICTILESAETLIDNASSAAGIAAFVPSVVTGQAIKANATALSIEIDTLKTEIDTIKKTLV